MNKSFARQAGAGAIVSEDKYGKDGRRRIDDASAVPLSTLSLSMRNRNAILEVTVDITWFGDIRT